MDIQVVLIFFAIISDAPGPPVCGSYSEKYAGYKTGCMCGVCMCTHYIHVQRKPACACVYIVKHVCASFFF